MQSTIFPKRKRSHRRDTDRNGEQQLKDGITEVMFFEQLIPQQFKLLIAINNLNEEEKPTTQRMLERIAKADKREIIRLTRLLEATKLVDIETEGRIHYISLSEKGKRIMNVVNDYLKELNSLCKGT